MKLSLSLLAIIILSLSTVTFAQVESFSTIENEVIEEAARPEVSPFQLNVTSAEREGEALRIKGSFKVYNEKSTTSPEVGYVLYSGEILGAKGIQRPALPQALDGKVILLPEEIREISFDTLLPEYFVEMHDGIELSLVNERGYTFQQIQTEVIHEETQYPRGKIQIEGKSIIFNKDQEYALSNGITLYANEDIADISITLRKTSTPVVVVPEITYFERTYFSEPALTKRYAPIVTNTEEQTVITLPVTLMGHTLSPTIYPFELKLDIQGEGFADPVAFGRLTLGGVSAKVINVGFNNRKTIDIGSQERLNTFEINADGALPDVTNDRRRQRLFDADVQVTFFDEGEVVYEDIRSTQVLPMNEYVFVLNEKLRLVDFDKVQVQIISEGRVLDTFTQTFDRKGSWPLNLIAGILLVVCLIGGFLFIMKKRKSLPQSKALIVGLLIASPFFISFHEAEAGARDYYDNRKGCERVQNIGGAPGGGGAPAVGVSGVSGSGSGDDGGVGGGVGAWFVADDWINKWEYVEGYGGTFGSGINTPGLSAEEIADLPDVMTLSHNLRSPAQGCYQPGEVVELNIEVSVALCDNSAAGINDDVDEVAVFQVTTEEDWFVDYNGEYDPALITEGNFTKPCPQNNDKTFGILHLGNPGFEEMYDRKQGWTILSQGENTTQVGGGSVNEVKTIYLQMPYEPGEYSVGTRLTLDPTKNGGITEVKESIEVEVCASPRDMCYLIEGLQYVDSSGVLRDASGNVDNIPVPASDPSIDEYIIQYVDHDEIVPGAFDNPTPASFGPGNNFTLQSVCNLCPNPLRPTLPLDTFTNRKEEWRDVTKTQVDDHEDDLIIPNTGTLDFPDDINRDYSEIAYQGLRTSGGSFAVENGDTQINDAIVQHYDDGVQNKGNQSRIVKGVVWRNFFSLVEDFDRLTTLQEEIRVLGQAATLKKREAELILDVIHLWTDDQGNEHYAEPFGEGLTKVYSGLVPAYHIDGGAPDNHAGNVSLYQNDADPLVPYDYNGHYHTHYVDNLRGIDDALRNIYDSPYDTTFYDDGRDFRDLELDQFNQDAISRGLPTVDYNIEYTLNEYQYPAGATAITSGWDISSGVTTYGVYDFDTFFTDQMKSALVQKWLQNNYGIGESQFDGCYGGDCFAGNIGSRCPGGACTLCSGASCPVTPFFVPYGIGTNSQVLAAHARTFDEYYANEPIMSTDNVDAYDFMKDVIWADLVSVRAGLLADIQEYKARQVDLLREFETPPPFFESAQVRKWPLVENYRLYREQIDLPFYDASNGYSLDTSYLAEISGITPANFTADQIRVYETYIKAYFNDSDLAMEYIASRINLDETINATKGTGLDDGDTSDTYIIQLISGNDRTCIAFEDICSDAGIQSAFLRDGDPNTVELYDIDPVTAEKIDSDLVTAGVNPRNSLSLATADVASICAQAARPVCPNSAAWDYDASTNVVYGLGTEVANGAVYDPTKNLCLTQCSVGAPATHYYDSADSNTTAQAVYDTSDIGTTALADWSYDSTNAATCQQDACPTISLQQELVTGSDPAQAQDVGNPSVSYYISALSGGGTQCVNEACPGSGLTHNGGSVFWNDGGTIRNLAGDDTNFNYDSMTDTCTSNDICFNLVGDQTDPPGVPSGYTAELSGGSPTNYCDYCATNLPGIQNFTGAGLVVTYDKVTKLTEEDVGWYKTDAGLCHPTACLTDPGGESLYEDPVNPGSFKAFDDDSETDYVYNNDTFFCQIDVCTNVDNNLQRDLVTGDLDLTVVPAGYTSNGDGTCSQTDFCQNIPGIQGQPIEDIPTGNFFWNGDYLWDSGSNTCDFCAGQNGRPDIAGVQHVQDGSYTNSGGTLGVLSDTEMYEYSSTNTWSLVDTLNTATCQPLICPNIGGGVGFTETVEGDIEFNGDSTDLEFTTGYNCGCSDAGKNLAYPDGCYGCLSTGYINESLGDNNGLTCEQRPDKLCQIIPGGGVVWISGDDYYTTADGEEVLGGNGLTYTLGTLADDRTCSLVGTATFELTTTPGFIDPGDTCTVKLEATNIDQCRITLLDSNFDTATFTVGNGCSTGDGSSSSMCYVDPVVLGDTFLTFLTFEQEFDMTEADGSILVVAECAPDGSDADGSLVGDYELQAESECRITPNIGEF